ncbi:unnamed protein product [Arabidopsis arenosa]|uniref:Uncharacterized protein n=1 Tax=Arabidopsis arenosa TaxID=38785 RepID=A0A8S1ZGU8_ARAAE|nr:unnamed protein product [Arabidopsis arenosa]
MANVTRKSSSEPEIQETLPSAISHGSSDQLPMSTSPTLDEIEKQHILKKTPNPSVPAIRDVEEPPNDPTERVLNFGPSGKLMSSSYEVQNPLRWVIGWLFNIPDSWDRLVWDFLQDVLFLLEHWRSGDRKLIARSMRVRRQ